MAFSPAHSAPARPVLVVPLAGGVLRGIAVSVWTDILLVGVVAAIAGLVRWPYLLMSPQFPSVGDTIMMALDVAEGRAFYLADSAPYLGAPYLWLLALVYKVFGPSLEATQLLAWTLGSLTIVPTYLLGREIGGRGAGVVAATFLATSGAHTVVTSHVALSHSATPLVTTFALWLVARAVNRGGAESEGASALARGGRLLAWSGLLAGLALQTHPTAAPLLVGAALGAVLIHPGWLRTRWPAIAVALVVVGYSTLLLHHVVSRFEVVGDIGSKQERYLDDDDDAGEQRRLGVYQNNLEQLSLSTVRLVSGALADRSSASSYLADPWIAATAVLALAGIVVGAAQRRWWLVCAIVLAMLLPPAFSGKYRPVLDGRYLMPLVPVLFVAIGLAAATLARLIGRIPLPMARGLVTLVLGGGIVLLAAHPISLLDTFYEDSQEDGFSNAIYMRTLQQVEAARRPDEAILLDPALASVKSTGGGKASSSFIFLLALEDIPSEQLNTARYTPDLAGRLAILHRSTADSLDNTMRLEPLDGKRLSGKDSPSYRAYRIVTVSARQP